MTKKKQEAKPKDTRKPAAKAPVGDGVVFADGAGQNWSGQIPADKAQQLVDEAALLGKITPTERARHHFGLEPRHVLKSREVKLEDGTIEVHILTQGGQRVFYPRDAERVLSDMEKGEAGPGAEPAGIFPAKA